MNPPLDFGEFVSENRQRAAYLITRQCFRLLPDAEIRELGTVFQEPQKNWTPSDKTAANENRGFPIAA